MDETMYIYEEQINRYLRGEMTQEEENLFEAEVRENDILRRQTIAAARLVKNMKTIGIEQDNKLIEKIKSSSNTKIPTIKWLTIAASFAIIFTVGYYFYDYSATTKLGKEYAYAFPMSEIMRGEEDEEVINTLAILFDNVANGEDLDNTIVQLADLWELSQSDTYNNYSTYEPYIGWNLAIAYLRNYDKKEAKEVLQEMQDDYPKGTVLEDKVVELLEEL